MQFGIYKKVKIMALKVWKLQILRGSIARRVFFRAILFATAMAIFPFLQLLHNKEAGVILDVNTDCCTQNVASKNPFVLSPGNFLKPFSTYAFSFLPSSLSCNENQNLTTYLFRELMDKKLLNFGMKAVCVGEGSASALSALRNLGFTNAIGVKSYLFSFLTRKSLVRGLDLDDNSFDFLFTKAHNWVSVSIPALFVLEIERILKPGGIGAILVETPNLNPGSVIKSVTPISSFLKSSDVVHVSSAESFSMVVFKKKLDIVNPFEHYQLPEECASVKNNKPFIEHLEPLVEKKSVGSEGNFSYLPKFVDVSSRKKFIYIDIGPGQFVNSNITNRFFNSYPIQSRAFNVYIVDHDTSALSSFVNKPGITFVYHPGLSGNNKVTESSSEVDDFLPYESDEGFDFLVWFRETVTDEDFVVVKMSAAGVELKFLHELFETGAICLVDELFLHCPGNADSGGEVRSDCVDMFQGLRSSGVFVHQWMEE